MHGTYLIKLLSSKADWGALHTLPMFFNGGEVVKITLIYILDLCGQ